MKILPLRYTPRIGTKFKVNEDTVWGQISTVLGTIYVITDKDDINYYVNRFNKNDRINLDTAWKIDVVQEYFEDKDWIRV